MADTYKGSELEKADNKLKKRIGDKAFKKYFTLSEKDISKSFSAKSYRDRSKSSSEVIVGRKYKPIFHNGKMAGVEDGDIQGFYLGGKSFKNMEDLMAAADRGEVDGGAVQRSVQEGGSIDRDQVTGRLGGDNFQSTYREGSIDRFRDVAKQTGKGRFVRKRQKGARPGRNAIVGGTDRRRQGSIATGQSGLSEDVTVARTILG